MQLQGHLLSDPSPQVGVRAGRGVFYVLPKTNVDRPRVPTIVEMPNSGFICEYVEVYTELAHVLQRRSQTGSEAMLVFPSRGTRQG